MFTLFLSKGPNKTLGKATAQPSTFSSFENFLFGQHNPTGARNTPFVFINFVGR